MINAKRLYFILFYTSLVDYLPPISKGLLVPVGLSILYLWYITEMAGFKSKLVPATIAASHWPACIAKMASCKQNNALEHAVSMATLGPV
jgi:hypothetical protein